MDKIVSAYMQIIYEEQEEVNEGLLKNAALAASIAIGAGVAVHHIKQDVPSQETHQVAGNIKKEFNPNDPDHLLATIKEKFNHIPGDRAQEIVRAAIKHHDDVFPQAHHLVALAGVESSMNPKAKSKLKKDPAIGLTQIRPKTWGIDKKELGTIDGQFKHSARILKKYHQVLGNPDDAIKAYNIGITNHKLGKQQDAAQRYHEKINKEVERIKSSVAPL